MELTNNQIELMNNIAILMLDEEKLQVMWENSGQYWEHQTINEATNMDVVLTAAKMKAGPQVSLIQLDLGDTTMEEAATGIIRDILEHVEKNNDITTNMGLLILAYVNANL